MGDNINTTQKNTEALTDASREDGLEVNTANNKYMFISHHQNAGQNNYIQLISPLKMWQSSDIWERQ
jgi:hypothetical protein